MYGVLLTATFATGVATLAHYFLVNTFNSVIGILLSCLLTPLTIAILIIVADVSILRHGQMMKALAKEITKWNPFAKNRTEVAASTPPVESRGMTDSFEENATARVVQIPGRDGL